MSKRLAYLLTTVLLVFGFHTNNALAQLSVSASQATGQRGDSVDLTLTIGAGGVSDEVDLSKISAYNFYFFWDPSVLSYSSLSSTADLSSAIVTPSSDSLAIDWFYLSFSSPVSFAGGLSITASFQILPGAPFGASSLTFGQPGFLSSSLVDENFTVFAFDNVTQGSPMQVTVVPSTSPVPEPAEVSLLLAGLGILGAVARRRKISIS